MHEKVEKRLFLIDGYGFVFRAYHSMPPLTNPAGTPVGAVYGFTNMLIKLKNRFEAANAVQTFMVCVLDSGKKTFRNDIYPEYKANRPEAPEDLRPQFPLIRDATAALSIPTIELAGFEADDIIATYARLATEQGIHVTIVSSDKDLMQLITEDVKMYDSLRDKMIDTDKVREKFGVRPDQVLDVLSLMGDSSDNIPGVPGIGPKTAADLLNEYHTLDGVYENIEKITKKKLKENLVNHKADAYLSKQLASLKNDVDIEQDISKFSLVKTDPQAALPFLLLHGFKSLAARLGAAGNGQNPHQPQAAQPLASAPWGDNKAAPSLRGSESLSAQSVIPEPVSGIQPSRNHELQPMDSGYKIRNDGDINNSQYHTTAPLEHSVTTITTRAEFAAWLPLLRDARKLAINIKLSKENEIEVFEVAKSEGEIANLQTISTISHQPSAINSTNQHDLFAAAAPQESKSFTAYIEVLKPYFESGSCNIIFSNLKNASKAAPELLEIVAFDDVDIMNYALNGTSRKLTFVMPEIAPGIQPGQEQPSDCGLAAQIFNIHSQLEQEIFNNKLNYVYYDIEKPLIKILARMEIAGIKIDKDILKNLSSEFNAKLEILEKEIFILANEEFNIGSPKQLGEVLFEHMGIQGGKKSKSGAYGTGSDILEELAMQGHSIAGKVLEWRGFSKLINTYTESLPEEINLRTGRVHTTFNQAATTTGRLSSTNPNLQNIPIRTEEGRKIRKAIIAAEGKTLIGIDYSQIELRLLAHMANIPVLIAAFKDGKDIHAATAAQVFGVDISQVDGELRRRAKTINFGIIYGQSAFGLAAQLGIPRGEAKTLIDKYFLQYPGIKKYMENTILQAHEQGFVTTLYGRKITLTGINDKNGAVRSFNERAAINAPLQGTAADIIKRAMILIDEELKNYGAKELKEKNSAAKLSGSPAQQPARLLLQIHDELIIECDTARAAEISALCKKIMEQVIQLSVPLIADANTGQSWAELH